MLASVENLTLSSPFLRAHYDRVFGRTSVEGTRFSKDVLCRFQVRFDGGIALKVSGSTQRKLQKILVFRSAPLLGDYRKVIYFDLRIKGFFVLFFPNELFFVKNLHVLQERGYI